MLVTMEAFPGLALADALHLRGIEGIELPAALALLLRADLRGPAEREGERLLQCWLAFDFAADVADDPAQPATQDTQLPLMPPELFGMGVAAGHHRGGVGDASIGLPQHVETGCGLPRSPCIVSSFGC